MVRSPTPPGLPPFSTREAQELRLTAPGRLERLAQLVQRSFAKVSSTQQVDSETCHEHQPGQSQSTVQQAQLNTTAEALRRSMRYNVLTAAPSQSSNPARISLPKGVRRTSVVGALTLAEDGSQVRGRFGNRASGHGVGIRTIDIHPLARLRESSGLQDVIDEIEKACAREECPLTDNALSISEAPVLYQSNIIRARSLSSSASVSVRPSPALETAHVPGFVPLNPYSTRRAYLNERRALKALEAERRENAELRVRLKALQHRGCGSQDQDRVTSEGPILSDSTNVNCVDSASQPAADLCSSELGSSEAPYKQTQNEFSGCTMPSMEEPSLYSSYASFSNTTASFPDSLPKPDYLSQTQRQQGNRSTVETAETMLEQQQHDHAERVAEQRCEEAEKRVC